MSDPVAVFVRTLLVVKTGCLPCSSLALSAGTRLHRNATYLRHSYIFFVSTALFVGVFNVDMERRARKRFARRVRLFRAARGWSQEVLAELCGLHRNYIGSVERAEHNVGLDNIEKIAHALGVSIRDLVDPEEPSVLHLEDEHPGKR